MKAFKLGIGVVLLICLIGWEGRHGFTDEVINGMSETTYNYMKAKLGCDDYQIAKTYVKDTQKWDSEAEYDYWIR